MTSQAQNRTLRGTVSDSKSSEPVSGASVIIKGTKKGVTTDAAGKFSIQSSGNAVLQITAVGYATQDVTPGSNETVSVLLVSTNQQLADVVVIGYGTRRKGSLTGAVSTVDAKTFQNRGPIPNPMAALQGQVPGVTVVRGSAQPGRENWNFLIRGNSSVNGSEPLIIVDGLTLPSSSALNSFNPADIESIEVLKDAYDTAI